MQTLSSSPMPTASATPAPSPTPTPEAIPVKTAEAEKEVNTIQPPAGVTFKRVFTNLPGDQEAIWTSPFHIKATDTAWLVPLAATSGVLIGSDHHSMERAQSQRQRHQSQQQYF